MDREYMLDSATDLGLQQLGFLESLLDKETQTTLQALDVQPGWRCLDLGAGGGSVTRWIADQVGPTGTVIAVDIHTDHLAEQPGVEILRHDINDGVPPGGPYDLIHTRLLLMHLSKREEIVRVLADALAPGGWLVIGEYGPALQDVVAAPSEADRDLFQRVQDTIHGVGRAGGISYEWWDQVDRELISAGLVDVDSRRFSHTTAGGTPGCLLSRNYVLQVVPALTAAGLTLDELDHYCDLLLDPSFRVWFYQFNSFWGRKPVAP